MLLTALPRLSTTEKCVVLLPSRGGVADSGVGPRRGAVEIDAGALPGRVILRGQGRNRHLDESRIAEIAGAIGIGALHRLDHDMQRGRRALLHLTHRKTLQDIEGFQEHDAAGRRQRHRDDVKTAIAAAHRRADRRQNRI